MWLASKSKAMCHCVACNQGRALRPMQKVFQRMQMDRSTTTRAGRIRVGGACILVQCTVVIAVPAGSSRRHRLRAKASISKRRTLLVSSAAQITRALRGCAPSSRAWRRTLSMACSQAPTFWAWIGVWVAPPFPLLTSLNTIRLGRILVSCS